MTLMLGDKREAQTAGERQVLMKDFKMEGILADEKALRNSTYKLLHCCKNERKNSLITTKAS